MDRPRTKRHLLVENAACLDVSALIRATSPTKGRAVAGSFPVFHHPSRTSAGTVFLRSEFEEDCGSVWLMFGLHNGQTVEQKIGLISVPRVPFGGRRWFFLCPQTKARACRLYLPHHGKFFLSREAYGLRYAVEHDTAFDSDIKKVGRLYTDISGEPPPNGALSLLPPRRKGMHQHTYQRLTWKFMFAKGRVFDRLAAQLDAQHARD
jgi:hypothetical protein